MYGLTLIAVLVVMGGLIAFFGDRIGTRVGKKKLTVFGLRPRHTSVLVTIVTGILIAASTLGVLSLTSQDVRTALFGMAELQKELNFLSQEVSTQNVELAQGRAALEAKTKEYSALTKKVSETAARLAAITAELKEVTAERDRTAAELDQVRADYDRARADLDTSRHEVARLQETKQQLEARMDELNKTKASLQSDVDRLNELTANLRKGISTVREGTLVFRAGEALAAAAFKGGRPAEETGQSLAAFIYQANQAILERLGITNKNLDVLWVSRHDFDAAVAALASAHDDELVVRLLAAGNTVYGEPVIGRIDIVPNRLIYQRDETVCSQTYPAAKNAGEAEEKVMSFLREVNAAAIRRGILPDPIQGTVGIMSGQQLYDTVNKVRRLGSSGTILLTAIAQRDIYTIGPLQIDIKVERAP